MEPITHSRHIYLAILPFQALSDDARVGMFCHGLAMDVIADLSRFRSFRILAYDAMKGLSHQAVTDSPALQGRQLDYILKGLVRQQGDKLLFNLQLVQARQNRLVWAEKFSGGFEELFQIQEYIVEKMAVSLQHFVDHDLLSEIRKKPLTSLNAYECWLRGFQELKKGTLEADEQARAYFLQAMDIDPHYPRAYTGMSLSFFNEWSCQLWHRWDVSRNGAFEWAQKALELDEWDHVSNAILGRIYVFNGEYEKAEQSLRKSLRINPNDPDTLVYITVGLAYLGYLDEALEHYERAKHLNPGQNLAGCGAFIHLELGHYEEAIALAEQQEAGKGWVDFPAYKAAAYYMKGSLDKMHASWQEFLNDFSQKVNCGRPADTATALKWMIDVNPYRGATRLQPFWEYMGQAGLVELRAAEPPPPLAHANRFYEERGGLWALAFGGKQVQLAGVKGLHDLARLLSGPNEPIHCTELMGALALEDGGGVFDEKAKAAYHKRILELQEEIEEAEANLNSSRLAALQEEYDKLLEHLSQAIGKGGKTRRAASSVEKCRAAVTWRIRSAIKKISTAHPALGKHLEVSVKTGVFCEYAPEYEVDWML
ncbi:MAG: hypothetical protein H6564_23235 [Lewinellaceae bacterium]|nr:hypothetical protein [Lewinellaceae bacterium]